MGTLTLGEAGELYGFDPSTGGGEVPHVLEGRIAAERESATSRRAQLRRRFGWRDEWTVDELARSLDWWTGAVAGELAGMARVGEAHERAGRWRLGPAGRQGGVATPGSTGAGGPDPLPVEDLEQGSPPALEVATGDDLSPSNAARAGLDGGSDECREGLPPDSMTSENPAGRPDGSGAVASPRPPWSGAPGESPGGRQTVPDPGAPAAVTDACQSSEPVPPPLPGAAMSKSLSDLIREALAGGANLTAPQIIERIERTGAVIHAPDVSIRAAGMAREGHLTRTTTGAAGGPGTPKYRYRLAREESAVVAAVDDATTATVERQAEEIARLRSQLGELMAAPTTLPPDPSPASDETPALQELGQLRAFLRGVYRHVDPEGKLRPDALLERVGQIACDLPGAEARGRDLERASADLLTVHEGLILALGLNPDELDTDPLVEVSRLASVDRAFQAACRTACEVWPGCDTEIDGHQPTLSEIIVAAHRAHKAAFDETIREAVAECMGGLDAIAKMLGHDSDRWDHPNQVVEMVRELTAERDRTESRARDLETAIGLQADNYNSLVRALGLDPEELDADPVRRARELRIEAGLWREEVTNLRRDAATLRGRIRELEEVAGMLGRVNVIDEPPEIGECPDDHVDVYVQVLDDATPGEEPEVEAHVFDELEDGTAQSDPDAVVLFVRVPRARAKPRRVLDVRGR